MKTSFRACLVFLASIVLTIAGPAHTADPVLISSQLAETALPYIYGSGDPARGGLDCSGFVQVVFRRAYGIELPDEAGKQYLYLREHGKVWDATTGWSPKDLQPGDLIFWSGTHRDNRPSPISHVMIYMGDNKMAGSQNAGKRLNAPGNGVGLFPFRIHPPSGNPTIDQEPFREKIHLYAYGRVLPVPTVP